MKQQKGEIVAGVVITGEDEATGRKRIKGALYKLIRIVGEDADEIRFMKAAALYDEAAMRKRCDT